MFCVISLICLVDSHVKSGIMLSESSLRKEPLQADARPNLVSRQGPASPCRGSFRKE